MMKVLMISLILFLLNTCHSAKPQKEIELNHPFQLKFNEAAYLKSGKLAVHFHSVIQDSRCPKSVQCITAGNATIDLELGDSKENANHVKLGTDQEASETTYQTYKMKLIEINPYP